MPIAEAHISGFRAALDSVARELRFLAFLEAPPLEGVCRRHMRIQGDYHDSYMMALVGGTNGDAAGLRL
jgi:hypothetical protein